MVEPVLVADNGAGHGAQFQQLMRVRVLFRVGKSPILTSNRAPADWYYLFPNPVVAESLPDRLINTCHHCIMNGPSYRPNKSPGRVVPTGNASSSLRGKVTKRIIISPGCAVKGWEW